MNSYTLLKSPSSVLEITPTEVAEITKFLTGAGGTVIWNREGETRLVPVAVLGNAFETFRHNLMLKRHRKIVDMPPVLIQLGQTIPVQIVDPPSLERVAQGATYMGVPVIWSKSAAEPDLKVRTNPPPYRRKS